MPVTPYLFFNGRCEEAVDFYKRTLGAKVEVLMRFKDGPPDMAAPGKEEMIMHACFSVSGTNVMASDGRGDGGPEFKGFSLSIAAEDSDEAKRIFAGLGDGGEVHMPLEKTFFAEQFGMVEDRFGVNWMIIVEPKSE